MIRTNTRSRRAGLLAVATAVLAAAPAALRAQDAPPPPPPGQPPMGGMRGMRGPGPLLEGITLTPAQQTQVDSIQSAGRARMQGMMQPGTRPDSATRAAMMQQRTAQWTAMRNVLTADQQKTFDANMAKMREQMSQRGPGGPRPRR